MIILGVSYNFHDSAACVVRDGIPVAAAEEERFSRRKHDPGFPAQAIGYCLREARITSQDIDAVAFYEKPARKLERALLMAKRYEPLSYQSFAKQFPGFINDGISVDFVIRERLNFHGPLYFSEHHLSHAASAFFVSPFEEAAILTIDGVGEWATCAEFVGRGSSIDNVREIRYPHSLGLLYSTVTAFLGFKVNNDEFKVMGLAAYGKPRFRPELDQLIELHVDGSFALSAAYFAYMHNHQSMYTPELERLLGPARRSHEAIEDRHRDIAASLQSVTEDAIVSMAQACRRGRDGRNLCLAGGIAYNCVANAKVIRNSGFEHVFIPPAAGDNGAAMGAALWACHEVQKVPRFPTKHHTMLGPAFSDSEILERLQACDLQFVQLEEEGICQEVASLIHKGLVIGWFQGRMEFGPRALGGRSILANPCSAEMKDILNARVKFREQFRPFAPAVIEESALTYFELDCASPFMLLTARVRPERAAEIPAVTHVDGTARVQTVSAIQQPLFHRLIECFAALSGVPVIINTSFNRGSEPIVCTPDDAIKCFLGTDIDCLSIGSFLVSKV